LGVWVFLSGKARCFWLVKHPARLLQLPPGAGPLGFLLVPRFWSRTASPPSAKTLGGDWRVYEMYFSPQPSAILEHHPHLSALKSLSNEWWRVKRRSQRKAQSPLPSPEAFGFPFSLPFPPPCTAHHCALKTPQLPLREGGAEPPGKGLIRSLGLNTISEPRSAHSWR